MKYVSSRKWVVLRIGLFLLIPCLFGIVDVPKAEAAPNCYLWGSRSPSRNANMTLYWSSSGAYSGYINQGVGSASPVSSGSKTFWVSAPPGYLTFTMYVNGWSGSSSCTYTTYIQTAPSCTIYLSPVYINPGQSSTVSWSIRNGSSATMWIGKHNQWTTRGASVPSGSFTRSWVSTGSTNFDLRVLGSGGVWGSCQATLTEGQSPRPSCSISVSPNYIDQGQSSTVSWSSNYGSSMYIQNIGYVNSSGSTRVYPSQTTTYSGTVSGQGGSSSCSGSRVVTVSRQCYTPWGSSVRNNSSVTAYQSSSVPAGSYCASQTRTCYNGSLSGSYQYQSCSVQAAAACTFNGQTVQSGNSVTAYQSSSVPYGSSCVSQSRTCYNGSLSGTYPYSSCSVQPAASCTFDGQTVPNGSSVTAYQSSSVPAGSSCVSQSRTCNNGSLSGSYQHSSCTVSAVPLPTPSISFSSSIVRRGSEATLTWSAPDADSCTVTGGSDSWNTTSSPPGGQMTSPLMSETTYTISCENATGTASASSTVRVSPLMQET